MWRLYSEIRMEQTFQKSSSSSSCNVAARCRAMSSPAFFIQPSRFLAAALQFLIWNKSTSSVLTAFCHLLLGYLTGILPPRVLWAFTRIISPCYVASPSGLKVLTLPQHHEPCNFLVVCDDPYPLGLKTSEYLTEDFPSNRLNHIDILSEGAHISLSHSTMLQMCVKPNITRTLQPLFLTCVSWYLTNIIEWRDVSVSATVLSG